MYIFDHRCDSLNDKSLIEIRLSVAFMAIMCLLPAWYKYRIVAMDAVALYIPTAKLFALGNFKEGFAQSHPLFALLIYLLSSFSGLNFEVSGRLVAAINFVLASLALFEITYKLSSDKLTAFIAALLLGLNPELVLRSVDCLKESLLISLVLWANYLILFSDKKKLRIMLGAILLGLALPLRSTVLFFVIGWLIVWLWHQPEHRVLRISSAVLILLSLIMILWFNRDNAFLCQNDFNINSAVSYLGGINTHRLLFIGKIAAEIIATGGYMAIIAGFHGYHKVNNTAWKINAGFVLISVFIVIFIMGWSSNRFLLLPLAWLYPAAAIGLVSWLKDSRKVLCVLAIVTLISLPLIWSYKTFRAPNPVMVNQKVAGLWIKDQFGSGQAVYSNRPRLQFYADANAVDVPANLAAVDMHHIKDANLFASTATSAGLVPIKSIGDIVIYQKKAVGLPGEVQP